MIRLIVHAPTPAALVRARRNVRNFLRDEPGAEVELVVNGAAAVAAVDEPDPETQTCVVLCENSLKAAGRDKPAGFRSVAAAVAYIARRQAEGWSYFRA